MVNSKQKLHAWLPAVVWASVIFATSCTVIGSKQFVHGVVTASGSHMTQQGFQSFWARWWWLFVKGYHALEFFILAALTERAIRKTQPFSRGFVVAISAFACFAYAASDEFHQTFVAGRGGKFSDVMIDSIGIVLAVVASLLFSQRERDRKPDQV